MVRERQRGDGEGEGVDVGVVCVVCCGLDLYWTSHLSISGLLDLE